MLFLRLNIDIMFELRYAVYPSVDCPLTDVVHSLSTVSRGCATSRILKVVFACCWRQIRRHTRSIIYAAHRPTRIKARRSLDHLMGSLKPQSNGIIFWI